MKKSLLAKVLGIPISMVYQVTEESFMVEGKNYYVYTQAEAQRKIDRGCFRFGWSSLIDIKMESSATKFYIYYPPYTYTD